MKKITKIDEWTIEMVKVNYHHEWLVYKGEKEWLSEKWFTSYKDALQYVTDQIEY